MSGMTSEATAAPAAIGPDQQASPSSHDAPASDKSSSVESDIRQGRPSTERVLLLGSLTAAGYGLVEAANKASTFDNISTFQSIIALSSAATQHFTGNDQTLSGVEYHTSLPDLTTHLSEEVLEAVWANIDLSRVTDVVFACITPFCDVRIEYVVHMLKHIRTNSRLRNSVILSNSGCLSRVNLSEDHDLKQSDIEGSSLLTYTSSWDKLMWAVQGIKFAELRYDVMLGASFERNRTMDMLSFLALCAQKNEHGTEEGNDLGDVPVLFPGSVLSYTAKRSFIDAGLAAQYILFELHGLEIDMTDEVTFLSLSMGGGGVCYGHIWRTICRCMGTIGLDPPQDESDLSGWQQEDTTISQDGTVRAVDIDRVKAMVVTHENDMLLKQAPDHDLPHLAIFDKVAFVRDRVLVALSTMRASGVFDTPGALLPDAAQVEQEDDDLEEVTEYQD